MKSESESGPPKETGISFVFLTGVESHYQERKLDFLFRMIHSHKLVNLCQVSPDALLA